MRSQESHPETSSIASNVLTKIPQIRLKRRRVESWLHRNQHLHKLNLFSQPILVWVWTEAMDNLVKIRNFDAEIMVRCLLHELRKFDATSFATTLAPTTQSVNSSPTPTSDYKLAYIVWLMSWTSMRSPVRYSQCRAGRGRGQSRSGFLPIWAGHAMTMTAQTIAIEQRYNSLRPLS